MPKLRWMLLVFAVLVLPCRAEAAEVYTLEKAVKTALERNFSVKAAEEGFKGAQQGARAARSAFGPVLGTGYDYDRRQHGVSSTGRLQDKELFTWRVYLNQNVFAGFATLADYQKAALQEESAQAGISQARLELIRTVQENFFIYLKAKQDDLVVDPYMGGGSTAVAAIKRGLKFVGVEIDPAHYANACKRIEDAQRQGDMFIDGVAA